jgi:hypothetical protein
MTRLFTMLAASLLLIATAASAQQGTAELRGQVVDQQGNALPGATITVRHQESGRFREIVSGEDGSFHLSALDPGVYEIEADLTGFKKYQARDIRIEVGRTSQVKIPLDVGGVEETVTVSGEAPLVDTTSKEIGGHVSAREFVDLPSFNRNFAGYLGMLPGVVASVSMTTFGADSISVAGQNVRNVNYTMDGSNNNDTFNGGNGGAQARVPVEAVQEFQLLTSQFDAEYGLSSGGIVNSVSKQGTNQFHGSAVAFFQDDKFTARDYFAEKQDLPKPQTKQQQFSGSLGGPIVRDKAHFFANVERVILDGGVTVNIPSRPDLARTDFENTRVWNTYVRGDHQLSANNTWGVRWLRETSPQPIQLLDNWTAPRTEAETDVDWTVVGNLSSVLGSTRVNTFRVSAVSEDVFFGNPAFNNGEDQRGLPPTLNHPSFSDGQSPRANRRLDVAYGADNVFAWFLPDKGGDHDLKFGLNYLYSTLRTEDYGNLNGTFTLPIDADFNAADPRTYPERLSIRVPGAVNFLMKGHFIGMFAQDKWQPIDRLTLNLGARYDIEILPTPNQDNPLFADDLNGYPMDTNNISPRLGVTYTLDPQGRSVVRGGFGLFFQRTSYTFLTNMFSNGRTSDSFTVMFPTNNADGGPRAGNLPTDPFLRNGPVVNHADIDAMFPPGTRARNTGTVRFDNPDRKVAWSRQYSIGYERQIGTELALSVDYIRSEQRDQYMLSDLNPGVRRTTSGTGTVDRVNPLVGAVGEFAARVDTIVNEGWIDYHTVQVSGTKRYSRGLMARLSYAWSRGRGNTNTGQADNVVSQFLDDLRLETEEGPTNVDRPHILSAATSWDVPRTGGLKLSAVFQARSGTPFSLIDTTFDNDRNGITANEYLPAGTYSGLGEDGYTAEYKGGRNGARGPNQMNLDMRAGYRFRLAGGRTIDAFVDVFNLTNEPNFANPTTAPDNALNLRNAADQRTSTFLALTGITNGGPTRTVQFNFRYGF